MPPARSSSASVARSLCLSAFSTERAWCAALRSICLSPATLCNPFWKLELRREAVRLESQIDGMIVSLGYVQSTRVQVVSQHSTAGPGREKGAHWPGMAVLETLYALLYVVLASSSAVAALTTPANRPRPILSLPFLANYPWLLTGHV